jgi:sensor histidine kinase YesM
MLPKVFHNLVENSLFHGAGVRNITFSAVKEDKGLVMTYRDDGKGIDDETRQWLFTKGRGHHGFGMFLSKEILALTGITIEEKGGPGKGARFVLTVPPGNFRKDGAD